MDSAQEKADAPECVAENNTFGKHRKNGRITTLMDSIREKQNALFESYHDIVLPPVIWNTLATLEATITDGSFETLLQLLKTQIEVESQRNPEHVVSPNTITSCSTRDLHRVHRRHDAVEKLQSIDDLRRLASSYSRTAGKGREILLLDIKQKFVCLINKYFPQKEAITDGTLADECNQRVQHLVEDGEKSLGRWCIRPDIAELDELVRKLNSSDDSQTIAQPRTPLQNAKTHQSLTIMLKSIDRFEPFLKVILEKTGAFNERIQCDLDTPLHYAVRSQNASFIEWLLGQKSLDLNCRNKQMKTALFLLCEQYKAVRRKVRDPKERVDQLKECRKYIILLLQNGADFNICSSKALLPYELLTQNGKPITLSIDHMQSEEQEFLIQCENVVQTKGGGQILKRRDDKFTTEDFRRMTVELLEIFLRFKDLNTFEKEFRKFEVKGDDESKVITLLLHTAVELNLQKCVDLIVGRYEKVIFAAVHDTFHLKYRVELKGLLRKACESCNPAILTKLLCKMEKDKLLINDECILVYAMNLCTNMSDESDRKTNLLKCAKLMATDPRIFHTKTDCYGNTALQVALKYGFTDIAKALIVDHKYMFLGVQNKKGETPLDNASYEFCKEYFDQCASQIYSGDILIDLDGINPYIFKKSHDNYKEIPRVRTQKGSHSRNFRSEMACLKKMAISKNHKQLLHHPVIYTFILVKWLRFSMWHCTNLLLTMAATAAFSYFSITHICHDSFSMPSYIASWFGFTYVLCRELLQWIMFGNKYFRLFQNWIDMAHVLGMLIVLGFKGCSLISSLVVIIFAIQIIQLIGSLPFNSISTYRCMFRVVALNFIKSIALFCPLILAFAYSFYLYYNDKLVPVHSNATLNPFASATATGVKISVMASGEFEASAMNISGSMFIIFLLFIFCIPMVMQNLINGLAVSDISEIRKQSESISLSEKVLLLARFESGLNRTINYKPIKSILFYLRRLSPGLFFRNYHHIIKIVVNDGARIMIDSRYSRHSCYGKQSSNCSKLSCLARQTKSWKGMQNGATDAPSQTDVEMGALLNNCTDSISVPNSPLRKKQKASKNPWEFIPRIPVLGLFSPVATLDEPVLEELLSIVKRKAISNARKPRIESSKAHLKTASFTEKLGYNHHQTAGECFT
ncbi:transient receptor potential cation channel protein painless-like [Ochlerotatus camptorhynchus]|uniref:transient receptor potential cation channel protein painless-like n=1 Tax=Ochlerotatus camptorhynchus TaxID=644619 RepID=UPI0031E1CCC7